MTRLQDSLRQFFNFGRRPGRQSIPSSTATNNTSIVPNDIHAAATIAPHTFVPTRPVLRKSDSLSRSSVYTQDGLARETRSIHEIHEIPSSSPSLGDCRYLNHETESDEQDTGLLLSSTTTLAASPDGMLSEKSLETHSSPGTTYTYFPDPQAWSSPTPSLASDSDHDSDSDSCSETNSCVGTRWSVHPQSRSPRRQNQKEPANLFTHVWDTELEYMDGRDGRERMYMGLELAVAGGVGVGLGLGCWC